jgi:hypothetical protein
MECEAKHALLRVLLLEEKGRRKWWWLWLCLWLCVWYTNSYLLTFNPNKPIRGQALYLSVTSQKRFIVLYLAAGTTEHAMCSQLRRPFWKWARATETRFTGETKISLWVTQAFFVRNVQIQADVFNSRLTCGHALSVRGGRGAPGPRHCCGFRKLLVKMILKYFTRTQSGPWTAF